MNGRPDIALVLDAGETLLWSGAPKPGRRTSARSRRTALLCHLAALLLVVSAWAIALFLLMGSASQLAAYALITVAALLTYLGLRHGILTGWRLRARDARTAYGITDRRAIAVAGPYAAEIPLEAATPSLAWDALIIDGAGAQLRFDRLDDAAEARDILFRQTKGQT